MENSEGYTAVLDETAEAERSHKVRVCAVILTFNRQPALQNCLAVIQRQTRLPDRVLVVDNHSSDNTCEYLELMASTKSFLAVLRTAENLGSAGGFAEGMTWATQQGFDYIWIMDDDCQPEPSCLENQIRVMGTAQDTVVFAQNFDQLNNLHNLPAWRGVLFPCQLVKTAGLPNKDLFWAVEDTEYLQWRLPRFHQVKTIWASDAVVRYDRFPSKTRPAWKFYYLSRNKVYYRLWVQRPWVWWRLIKLGRTLTRMWLRVALLEDQKMKKFRYLLLGVWHGLRGKLGKTIEPV